MRLRLPRFGERTRKFLREVGSVVLGVLIALGLGAVASDIGWRIEVANARQQIRYELGHNRELARWASDEVPCVTRRLEELAAILTEASRTRRLPPLGGIGTPGFGSWPRGVWDATMAAQTAAHFPASELHSLSRVYRTLEGNSNIAPETRSAWMTLSMMTGPGRTLDPGSEAALYAALAHARMLNERNSRGLGSLERYVAKLLPPDYLQLDPVNPPIRGANNICDPLSGKAVASYGASAPSGLPPSR